MRKLIVIIASLFFMSACSSGRGGVGLAGRVVDNAGTPVPGATVTTSGARAVTTDAAGEFRFTGLRAVPRRVVNVAAAGFVETTEVYSSLRGGGINVVVIWPRAAAVTVDAGTGGSFPLGNGGSLAIPPNAFVDAAGQAVGGPVSVSATYFDVSDVRQLRAVPGDFTARMSDGSERVLESFGVFDLALADSSARPVNFAPGVEARVAVPIPDRFREVAPDLSGRFLFDPNAGRWIENGSFVQDGPAFVGSVTAAGTWNIDVPIETTCIIVRVTNPFQNDMPEANCFVEIDGEDFASSATGHTNASGEVCLVVKRNALVKITAFSSQRPNWVSMPKTITTSNQPATSAACGMPGQCPTVDVVLDLIIGPK